MCTRHLGLYYEKYLNEKNTCFQHVFAQAGNIYSLLRHGWMKLDVIARQAPIKIFQVKCSGPMRKLVTETSTDLVFADAVR